MASPPRQTTPSPPPAPPRRPLVLSPQAVAAPMPVVKPSAICRTPLSIPMPTRSPTPPPHEPPVQVPVQVVRRRRHLGRPVMQAPSHVTRAPSPPSPKSTIFESVGTRFTAPPPRACPVQVLREVSPEVFCNEEKEEESREDRLDAAYRKALALGSAARASRRFSATHFLRTLKPRPDSLT